MTNPRAIRTRRAALGTALAACLLTACGDGEAPAGDESAATDTEAGMATAPIADRLAAADDARGKTLYFQCRACHSLESGGMNKVGPNLHGIFGRKAGLAPGFAYSDVMSGSDVVWTDQAMDEWLARPGEFMPGNRMVFVGVRDPQDRADLIAYLKQETGTE